MAFGRDDGDDFWAIARFTLTNGVILAKVTVLNRWGLC